MRSTNAFRTVLEHGSVARRLPFGREMKPIATIAKACLVVSLAVACGDPSETAGSASAAGSGARAPTARPIAPPPVIRPSADPNPLGLPARSLDVPNGARVFTVPEPMLRGAKLGSSMQLRAGTVVGRDGEHLMIDGRDGPDYPVHAAYVIPLIPGKQRPRIKAPVVAEWAQGLRHGVVRRYAADKVVVRFTDTQDKSDRTIEAGQLMAQTDGFHAGNYAALRSGRDLEHVLLVSPVGGEAKDAPEWFVLGYLGSARLVKTDQLLGVPISFEPKLNSSVLAEHLGKMRPGIVKELDAPGVMSVRFDRAGRAVTTGWGLVMPPVAGH